jgi:hypothetical protein
MVSSTNQLKERPTESNTEHYYKPNNALYAEYAELKEALPRQKVFTSANIPLDEIELSFRLI